MASPSTARVVEGFDARWRNIIDAGSPIDAAHYQVVNSAGEVVVPTRTVKADNPQAIESLDTPRERGAATLRLWLSDSEGNVGAPVIAPLAYDCIRSEVGGGLSLSAGLGQAAGQTLVVNEGEGSVLTGKLRGAGQVANAPLCVFSNVVTDSERQFLGIAMTGAGGDYQFAVGAGPSRAVSVVYRPGQRELTATATLQTKVRPMFQLAHKVVHNKGVAVFKCAIPGPHDDKVVIVLQVKDGTDWRVFRRYRTREGGKCLMRYRFTQTETPTKYRMRAEVPDQSGYPYLGGTSVTRTQIVLP